MSTVYCSECGVQNDAGAGFCGNCGSKLGEATTQPMKTEQQPPQGGYQQQPPQGGYQQQPPQGGYQQPQQGFNPANQGMQGYNQGGLQRPRKDPSVGYLGTFFIPGFAHMYTDEVGTGIILLIITFFTYIFFIGFIIHIGLFFYLWR